MRRSVWLSVAVGLVLAGGTAGADVWDIQTENDNTSGGTENELVHGTVQRHDLGSQGCPFSCTADLDWYRVGMKPRSSYEVIVDGTSGDIGWGVSVQRIASDGVSLNQDSVSITPGLDYSRSLRWENAGGTVNDQFIRVMRNPTTAPGCTGGCGSDDVYDIRFRETTIAVPRFNNSGGQVTVLIIQNAAETSATGNAYFRNTAGAVVSTTSFTLPGQTSFALNTNVGGAAGQSGSITISHTGRYGDLAVKAIALEPATGFSFDTPGLYRPF